MSSPVVRWELPRALGTWRWPIAVGFAAVCGSFYTLNSSEKIYWCVDGKGGDDSNLAVLRNFVRKFIPEFMKGRKPSISPEDASNILRKFERRCNVNEGVVSYFETNLLGSNSPIEDRHVECQFLKISGLFFGVFDGHSGWQCAEALENRLPFYTAVSLLPKAMLGQPVMEEELVKKFAVDEDFLADVTSEKAYKCNRIPAGDLVAKQKEIGSGVERLVHELRKEPFQLSKSDALNKAFTNLDDDICTEAIPLVEHIDQTLLTGISGSCALAAYVEDKQLYIANTGDCRAVLGSKKPDGTWVATPLSVDQVVSNQAEIQRLLSEHPGEDETVIRNKRLLGQLQPLRAFGDVQYKWNQQLHDTILHQIYGRQVVPRTSYTSPPYLTAKPVISHHHLRDNDKFLILATDGLWESLSNEKAVQLVGKLIHNQDKKKSDRDCSLLEDNAATLLIRHAIGGADHVAVAEMLSLQEQYRRLYRDDITVNVLYFDVESAPSKL